MHVVSDERRVVGEGHTVDLGEEPVESETVETAIRGETGRLSVDCPAPSRWWAALARPEDGTEPLDRVVAAARSRGHHPPAERALAAVQRDLRNCSVEQVDTAATRRRLAEAGTDVERLREEVAAARGRLRSRQDMGADTADAEAALEDATRRLSEAETERVAAEQAHEAAQQRAREAREARERRLRLQDREANRRRDLRRGLAVVVSDAFAAAVDAVPGSAALSTDPLGIDGDHVTAALAAARIADLQAPVIDATGRFESADAAAAAVEGPVIRL